MHNFVHMVVLVDVHGAEEVGVVEVHGVVGDVDMVVVGADVDGAAVVGVVVVVAADCKILTCLFIHFRKFKDFNTKNKVLIKLQ